MRSCSRLSWLVVTAVFVCLIATLAFKFSSRTTNIPTNDQQMVFVLATDNNFVAPTAVTIQSVKLSTPQSKIFVIIADTDVTQDSQQKLLSMADSNNQIIFLTLNNPQYQSYIDKAMKFKTKWHRLVALRLVYPEILQNVQIDNQPIQKFIHLDSDLYVLRDLSEFWNTSFPVGKLFISADCSFLHKNSLQKLQQGSQIAPYFSGGVVLWNFSGIRKKFSDLQKNLFLEDAKNLNTRKQLITHPLVYSLVQKIRHLYSDSHHSEAFTPKKFFNLSPSDQKKISSQIETDPDFIELKKQFPEYFSNTSQKIAVICFIYHHGTQHDSRFAPEKYEEWKEEVLSNEVTEETVFNPYSHKLPFRYNFLVKRVFTDIQSDPQPTSQSLEAILLPQFLKCPEILATIKNEIQNMKILHFFAKLKPWSKESQKLIAQDPDRYQMLQFYFDLLETTPWFRIQQQNLSSKEYSRKVDHLISHLYRRFLADNALLH